MKTQKTTHLTSSQKPLGSITIGFSFALTLALFAWFYLLVRYGISPDAMDYTIAGALLITFFLILKRKKAGWTAGVVLTVYQLFRLGMWTAGHADGFVLVAALLSGFLMGYALYLLLSPSGWQLFFEDRRQVEQKLLVCGGIVTLLILGYFKFYI